MSMRKASREMDAAFALEVLDKAPVYPCRWLAQTIRPSISIVLWMARSWTALQLIPVWHFRQSPAARLL